LKSRNGWGWGWPAPAKSSDHHHHYHADKSEKSSSVYDIAIWALAGLALGLLLMNLLMYLFPVSTNCRLNITYYSKNKNYHVSPTCSAKKLFMCFFQTDTIITTTGTGTN